MMTESLRLELLGQACPMPVLKTKKALARLSDGALLEVLTDDPHAVADLKVFCEQSGHCLESQTEFDGKPGVVLHRIRRRPRT